MSRFEVIVLLLQSGIGDIDFLYFVRFCSSLFFCNFGLISAALRSSHLHLRYFEYLSVIFFRCKRGGGYWCVHCCQMPYDTPYFLGPTFFSWPFFFLPRPRTSWRLFSTAGGRPSLVAFFFAAAVRAAATCSRSRWVHCSSCVASV